MAAKNKKKLDSPRAYQKVSGWDVLKPSEVKEMENQADRYIQFLNECKTERETINFIENHARKQGFKPIAELKPGSPAKSGTKVYWINKNRAIGLAVIGKKPATAGLHIVAAHHDVPHLDLKPLPLIEKHGLAFFKTHYYGGIKKFQWCAIPLAIHGFASLKNGKSLSFSIGENPKDPVFTITDIAPHLSAKIQNDRKANEVLKGEELTVLVGHKPLPGKGGKKDQEKISEKVKAMVLEFLFQNYGLTEEDLAWAEVCMVPAIPAREVGFDRSMIGGFGHDDRACVMATFDAIATVKNPVKTAVGLFFDKEEIGSAGASGAQSVMVSDFLGKLVELSLGKSTYALMRQSLSESFVLSGDASAALEPTFEGAFDPTNAGFLGNGVWICRYTGSGGKYMSSEADVEFIAKIRNLLVSEKIPYQFGEMGKVDEGGGGTVAKYLAQLNMHVLDLALPVLSLHSPFEIVSKVDYHFTISAYKSFFEKEI